MCTFNLPLLLSTDSSNCQHENNSDFSRTASFNWDNSSWCASFLCINNTLPHIHGALSTFFVMWTSDNGRETSCLRELGFPTNFQCQVLRHDGVGLDNSSRSKARWSCRRMEYFSLTKRTISEMDDQFKQDQVNRNQRRPISQRSVSGD